MYGDTHITGIHISLVICVRGYTYHGDTHITVSSARAQDIRICAYFSISFPEAAILGRYFIYDSYSQVIQDTQVGQDTEASQLPRYTRRKTAKKESIYRYTIGIIYEVPTRSFCPSAGQSNADSWNEMQTTQEQSLAWGEKSHLHDDRRNEYCYFLWAKLLHQMRTLLISRPTVKLNMASERFSSISDWLNETSLLTKVHSSEWILSRSPLRSCRELLKQFEQLFLINSCKSLVQDT